MSIMLSKNHLWEATVFAGLAFPGFKSKGSVHTKGRVFSTLQSKTPLSRSPVKNKHLKESLQALIQKQAVEKVFVPSSLAFYNRSFLVPKPKWRSILVLSQLNLYLASASFKMETLETIRLSLQQGEWVTSLDFSDAYFHVPICQRSRKYLRFHLRDAYLFSLKFD